ncbi:Uma2 family endonuclease [Halothece sp. PCC 7418]|uniref:Uma2 family endonuclease n=1 Tax=Halothece sp. (strain PCC 7418) TaxID=65093 RepID=UPI00059F481A|nr:Uma2 family endonuclease [Halothece sp. PCC 7418]
MPIAIPKGFKITPEQFDQLAEIEQLSKIELTETGELIVMSPTGGEAGEKNFNLYIDLGIWNRQTRLGKAFDSSTVFVLPNGARRSPDVSWIRLDRWDTLTSQEKQGFPPIAPDFVIELVSPSDLKSQRYEDLQAKMQEYIANGVQLGWLIEPSAKTVEIYQLGQPVAVLNHPQTLSGQEVLPGFVLDLSEILNN